MSSTHHIGHHSSSICYTALIFRFPAHTNCPDSSAYVSVPIKEDNPNENYYFPDFDQNSCGHGRNYPAWMGLEGYERWYLFINPTECCEQFFPLSSNCPYENTPQTGYYWEIYHPDRSNDAILPEVYNHSFYPDIQAGTCINGTDYPVSVDQLLQT